MKPNRLSQLTLILSLCLLSTSAMAATQLEADLKIPFGPNSNPFTDSPEIELPLKTQAALKNLLLTCLYRPLNAKYPATAHVRRNCHSQITTQFPRVEIYVDGLNLTAVSWDGDNSDHGDELALGIYSATGVRVAIYKSLFIDGNTLDALTASFGIFSDLPGLRTFAQH